ncbi:MAG: hypothetical protein ABIA21_03415 [Candidatus Aenigmatarchaeota archaeon]
MSGNSSSRKPVMVTLLVFALVLLMVAVQTPAMADATNLSSCQEINVSGDYVVTSNIFFIATEENSTCFNISVDNVNLDCQNMTILGTNMATGITVNANNGVTIKNCFIENWTTGIFLSESNATLSYNEICNNTLDINRSGIDSIGYNNTCVVTERWNDVDSINCSYVCGVAKCYTNWTCGEWSTCVNSTQNRTCADQNACGKESGRPVETQSCNMSAECGNSICDSNETCSICEADCGVCSFCGDGICDANESCELCSSDCGECPVPICGDGVLDESEVCDSNIFGDRTCVTEGFTNGTLTCDSNCTILFAGCWNCGDGVCGSQETSDNCPVDCSVSDMTIYYYVIIIIIVVVIVGYILLRKKPNIAGKFQYHYRPR